MNEKGLAGGALYFPDFASYTAPEKADPSTALAPWEFLSWVLSNFSTVAEVKAAIDKAVIVDLPAPMVNFTLPFHFPIHDATGASIVIEPIDGKLKVYDNPMGVLTNSPTFDWHLNNVRNYVKMSPVAVDPLKIGGKTFTPFGQGSGLLGIPGDPTPPSRFIRALGYAASAKQLPDGPQTVRLVEHIMNNFDIPIGFIDSAAKGGELEYTVDFGRRPACQEILHQGLQGSGPADGRSEQLRSGRNDAERRAVQDQPDAAAPRIRQAVAKQIGFEPAALPVEPEGKLDRHSETLKRPRWRSQRGRSSIGCRVALKGSDVASGPTAPNPHHPLRPSARRRRSGAESPRRPSWAKRNETACRALHRSPSPERAPKPLGTNSTRINRA